MIGVSGMLRVFHWWQAKWQSQNQEGMSYLVTNFCEEAGSECWSVGGLEYWAFGLGRPFIL